MEQSQTSLKKTKLNLDFKDSKYATGRRKKSIAKVWIKKGSGKIYVNGKLFNQYFASDNHKSKEFVENMDQYFAQKKLMDDMKCLIK